MNSAVPVELAVTSTVQAAGPEQPPVHPTNSEPDAGLATRVSEVPLARPYRQSVVQAIPADSELTVPDPSPPVRRVNRCTFLVGETRCSSTRPPSAPPTAI